VIWGCSSTLLKWSYHLPGADEVNVMVFNTVGDALTLGVYGVARGRQGSHDRGEWTRSLLPMGMMAGGDIGFIVATRYGPVSLTTPFSGAYPVITVVFARLVLKERISAWQGLSIAAILAGWPWPRRRVASERSKCIRSTGRVRVASLTIPSRNRSG
jgi:drug/metabolite transporter (DMT)-like permease